MTIREKLSIYEIRFDTKFKTPKFEDSIFQERLLRIGKEYECMCLESPYDKYTTNVVIDSIISDIVSKVESILVSTLSIELKSKWCKSILS